MIISHFVLILVKQSVKKKINWSSLYLVIVYFLFKQLGGLTCTFSLFWDFHKFYVCSLRRFDVKIQYSVVVRFLLHGKYICTIHVPLFQLEHYWNVNKVSHNKLQNVHIYFFFFYHKLYVYGHLERTCFSFFIVRVYACAGHLSHLFVYLPL